MQKKIRLIKVREAAQRLHCSTENIRRLIKCRKLRGTNEFGDWLVDEEDLERKLNEAMNRRGAAA